MRRSTLVAMFTGAVLAIGGLAPSVASASACAGASICPWTSTSSFGAFGATAMGFPNGQAFDGSSLWVAETYNRIDKLDPTTGATEKVIGRNGGDGSSGSGDGEFSNPGSVAIDGSGNVWVVDGGNNRIQEFSSGGTFIKAVGWGVTDGSGSLEVCTSSCQRGIAGGGSGQFNDPVGIAIDGTGNVWVADGYNNRLQELSAAGVFEAAIGWGVTDGNYLFQTCTTTCRAGYTGNGAGQFNFASDIAIDSNGIYATDQNNHRVQEFQLTSPFTQIRAGGSYGTGNDQLYYPRHLGLDASGNVYVSDTSCNGPEEFDSTLNFVSYFVHSGECGQTPEMTYRSASVAFDTAGDMYIGDYDNRIQVFDSTPSRGYVATFSAVDFGGSGVILNGPVGVAYDGSGDLFVADTNNRRVLKLDPTGAGTVLAKAGANGGTGGFGFAPGGFQTPVGIALDPTGAFLYVSDQDNCNIQTFATSDLHYVGPFKSLCGNSPGQLNGPRDMAVDASGNVYVDEYYGNRVDEFASDGTFIRRWGRQFGNGPSGNGPGEFSGPLGVGFDAQGHLLVADSSNNRMQAFTPTGTYLWSFGSPGNTPGLFNNPRTPRVDAGGETVVTDPFNNRLETFAPDGTFLLQWGSLGTGTGQVSDNNGLAIRGQTLAVSNWDQDSITTFTFPAVAAASNAPVSSVTTTTATLNGSVDPGGGALAYRWEYGPTTGYGSASPVGLAGGSGGQSVTATITGLEPGTTYHAELVASSPGGSQTTQDFTFTTATGAPGATGSQGSPGQQGSLGQQGPAGQQGSPGQQGQAGPQGPPGAQGPGGLHGAAGLAGPNGADGKVTCKLIQPKGKRFKNLKFSCTTTGAAHTGHTAVRLLRGRRVVASGTLSGSVIRVSAARALAPGRYTVEVLRRTHGDWTVARRYTITLRR